MVIRLGADSVSSKSAATRRRSVSSAAYRDNYITVYWLSFFIDYSAATSATAHVHTATTSTTNY
jgi:hypothetical protein